MADSVINYSDLIGKDDTFSEIFANIERLKKELAELAKQAQKDLDLINPNNEEKLKKAVKQVEDLTKASKQLETERKKAVKTRKKLADLTDEELIQREKQRIANRERVQIAKQTAIVQSQQAGQIEKLRAQLSLTTLQWKKLSKNELENGKEGKKLIKTKKRLTEELKRLEKQTGDNRRNVGNYTSSLGRLGKVALGIFVGRNLISGIRRVGGAFVDLFKENQKGNETFEKFSNTVTSIISTTKKFGVQILEFIIPAFQRGVRLFQFAFEKIRDFGSSLSGVGESSSIVGKILTAAFSRIAKGVKFVTSLFTEFPFIFAGIVAGAKQLRSNLADVFTKLSLRLQILFENIKSNIPFQDEETQQKIQKNIERLKTQLDTVNKSQKGVGEAFREAFNQAKNEFEEFSKARDIEDAKIAEAEKRKEKAAKRREASLKRQNELLALQQSIEQNISSRVEAIVSLQNQIEQAEANSIEDSQERLLRLEELKAKAVNEQREKQFDAFVAQLEKQEEELIAFFGENSAEVLKFREEVGDELLLLEKKNQLLSELQLQESEARKKAIRDKAKKETVKDIKKAVEEISAITKTQQEKDEKDLEDFNKKQRELVDLGAKIDEQNAKDKEKRQKKLFNAIAATSQKIGDVINAAFEKQLNLATSLVEQQSAAVDTQRERAEQGLKSTLAFEQQELADREAERIRAEKKAKQAAEFITLLNLVSAYAASGDSNALARGLIDFSLLKALETGLGFEEGGYTGDNGTKDIAGVVHGQEYVVRAEDVKRFGLTGKGGDEFGEAMSDYFYSPLQQNLYDAQANNFKKGMTVVNKFASLENEVKEMRKAFQSMPQKDYDLVQMTDYFVEISKRVTQNKLTNVSKQRKRL